MTGVKLKHVRHCQCVNRGGGNRDDSGWGMRGFSQFSNIIIIIIINIMQYAHHHHHHHHHEKESPGFLNATHHRAVAGRSPLVAPVLRAVSAPDHDDDDDDDDNDDDNDDGSNGGVMAPIVAGIAFIEVFTSNKNGHCHQCKAYSHPSETMP